MIRFAVILSLIFFSTNTFAQQKLSRKTERRIDSIFASVDRTNSPGYAIGVIKKGKLILARGYGLADLDNNIPITSHTVFHLASVSKQFTAAAIALLILDGKLSLDTPVENFFPEVKKYNVNLQIKHLIYFTSGLPDYTTLPRASGDPWFSFHYFNIEEAVATSLSSPRLKFAPGTQWEYSNINYMLLAKIVERISEMSLDTFLKLRIFSPLGMNASMVNDDVTTVIPGRATGYADRSDEKVREQLKSVGVNVNVGKGYARLPRISPHYGGSGVFSTIADLAKWDQNFYSHKLAGPTFTQQILHREKFTHDKDNDAFGLVFGKFQDREMIWFSGGDLDGSTFIARLPKEQLTVICLSNMPMGNAEQKAREILDVLLKSQKAGGD